MKLSTFLKYLNMILALPLITYGLWVGSSFLVLLNLALFTVGFIAAVKVEELE